MYVQEKCNRLYKLNEKKQQNDLYVAISAHGSKKVLKICAKNIEKTSAKHCQHSLQYV